jgi:hypothetical protein
MYELHLITRHLCAYLGESIVNKQGRDGANFPFLEEVTVNV